jgi:hypothetical protein
MFNPNMLLESIKKKIKKKINMLLDSIKRLLSAATASTYVENLYFFASLRVIYCLRENLLRHYQIILMQMGL